MRFCGPCQEIKGLRYGIDCVCAYVDKVVLGGFLHFRGIEFSGSRTSQVQRLVYQAEALQLKGWARLNRIQDAVELRAQGKDAALRELLSWALAEWEDQFDGISIEWRESEIPKDARRSPAHAGEDGRRRSAPCRQLSAWPG